MAAPLVEETPLVLSALPEIDPDLQIENGLQSRNQLKILYLTSSEIFLSLILKASNRRCQSSTMRTETSAKAGLGRSTIGKNTTNATPPLGGHPRCLAGYPG